MFGLGRLFEKERVIFFEALAVLNGHLRSQAAGLVEEDVGVVAEGFAGGPQTRLSGADHRGCESAVRGPF